MGDFTVFNQIVRDLFEKRAHKAVLVELDRCRTAALATLYLHLLLLLIGKRSARIAHDLATELVRVVTSRMLPLNSHQVCWRVFVHSCRGLCRVRPA